MRHTRSLVPFVLSLLALPSTARAEDPSRLDAVRRAVDAGNAAWIDGMKRADPGPIAATFDADGVNLGVNGDCQKGPREVERAMREFLAQTGPAVSTQRDRRRNPSRW